MRINYILLSNFDRIRKSKLSFLGYYSIESICHNSFKACKFPKTGAHGKYILVSSRAKLTRLPYLKLMSIKLIKSFFLTLFYQIVHPT